MFRNVRELPGFLVCKTKLVSNNMNDSSLQLKSVETLLMYERSIFCNMEKNNSSETHNFLSETNVVHY